MDDGKVSLGTRVDQSRGRVSLLVDNHISESRNTGTRTSGTSITRLHDKQISQSTERIVDLNIVQRKHGNRESHTAILSEEEWERARERTTSTKRLTGTSVGTANRRLSHDRDITDHVTVTEALSLRQAELEVHIKPMRIKLVNRHLIEHQRNLGEQVVHQVTRPANASIAVDIRHRRRRHGKDAKSNLRDLAVEPHVQDVIRAAAKRNRSIALVEVMDTLVTERARDEREPIGLHDTTDKVAHSLGRTVKMRVREIECGKIDKRSRWSTRRDVRHGVCYPTKRE